MSAQLAPEAEPRKLDEHAAVDDTTSLPPPSPIHIDAPVTTEILANDEIEPIVTAIPNGPTDDSTEGAAEETDAIRQHTPQPIIKRSESLAVDTDSNIAEDGEKTGQKRKRRVSPPWQFPTVENTTFKSADGRRVSARVTTTTPGPSDSSDGRARSISISHSSRSRKPSPPWRAFGAEGPTSINVDGKRKSGRVNRESEDQPKRTSPRNKKQTGRLGVEQKGEMRPASRGRRKDSQGEAETTQRNGIKREDDELSPPRTFRQLKGKASKLQSTRSFAVSTAASANHKRKQSNDASEQPTKTPVRMNQRPQRHGQVPDSLEITKPSPKLKLRLTNARHAIAPLHPLTIPPSRVLPPRPSLHQVLERCELRELQLPHLENERGPPDADWFLQRNEKQAVEEAAMRKRIVDATKPQGPLSKDRLSIFYAEPQREPPQQYGHHDHLVAHALYFRHLLAREKVAHKALAKKVAYEALEYWKLKRGPTKEEIQAEEEKTFKLIYRQVGVDIQAKWNMVAAYVQNLRKIKYEAEEEQRRQQRLQRQLEWSEKMIAKQRGDNDSDSDPGEDSTGDMIDSEDDDDDDDEDDEEENMSDSESESGASDTAGGGGEMGEDELAAYLAQRAAEPPDDSEAMELDESETELATEDISEAAPVDTPRTAEDDPTDDLVEPDAGPVEEDSKTDGEVAASETEDSKADEANMRTSTRQAGGDSAIVEPEEFDPEDDTSDESVDMFDSDEDMSSTGDENDEGENDSSEDGDDESEEEDVTRGMAGFLLTPKEIADVVATEKQLPTPTTSAEGDARDPVGEGSASLKEDDQTEAGADENVDAAEDETMLDAVNEAVPSPPPTAETTVPEAEPVENALVLKSSTPDSQCEDESRCKVPPPSLLRGELRSYQYGGLKWLASLNEHGTNGILADEMGLGKTIQTISLLAHLAEQKNVWDTHLVIVPTSVVLNWVTEFQRFLPGFRVLGYYGSLEERQAKRRGWVNDPHHHDKTKRGYNVVITSYNVAMQDINAIRNVQWHYLVLDEAHNIRNFNSQRWQVLIRLRTRGRLLLTGTPLQNSLSELWSLLTFLTAGDDDPAHGNLEEFLSHWKEPVKEIFDRGVSTLSSEAQKIVDQLHISLRPFLLRRLKTEVEKDLPKKTESVVVCKLSKRQRQLYQEYMGLASTRESLQRGNAVSAGKVLMSLRRVCNHPDLFDPRPIQTSYAMEQSVLDYFFVKENLVRKMLGIKEDLPTNLIVSSHEGRRKYSVKRSRQLAAIGPMEKKLKEMDVPITQTPDVSSPSGMRALQRLQKREKKLQRLRDSIEITKASLKDSPVYGTDLRELLTLRSGRQYTHVIPGRSPVKTLRGWPAISGRPLVFEHKSDWLLSKDTTLQRDVLTLDKYAEQLNDTIARFAFCTPVATAPVLKQAIAPRNQELLRASKAYPTTADFGHEARQRTSIVFPDSRLLVYDSGKLQRLAVLLRDLQARGSRSLIFTQMVRVLDILEQFLSLMGLPYLRLDGSTSVERRQMYSAEFNQPDSKYQCMILSSRAGGVGLNLTGASSVIFYDLDWNPQMDRQCMDRAHRIGQVRDVEVYKMVSEKTVEENILRRANQKSLLDQTVIQEGQFTTDYQQRSRVAEVEDDEDEPDVAAAIERYLGGGEKANTQAMESVEDKEDVQAAQQARKEDHQDDADFADRSSKGPSGAATPGLLGLDLDDDAEVDDGRGRHVDSYMIREMERLLADWKYVPPPVRRLDKHGRDRSHRPKRKR